VRKIPRIVSVTALRDRAASVLTALSDSDDPMIITQRGRAAAILLSVKAYEQYEREQKLLRVLVRAEKEIDRKAGVDYGQLLDEAESLLRDRDSW